MRTRIELYLLAAVLLACGLVASGCAANKEAEAQFEPTPTPGIVRVGAPAEILLDEAAGCFHGRSMEGEALIGQAGLDDEAWPAVVDLAAQEAHRLSADGIRLSLDPVRYVAWVQDRDPDTYRAGLLVYDLEQGSYWQVAEGRLRTPDVSGDLVVWEQIHPESRGVYGYNLSRGQQFVVTETVKGAAGFPYVSGDWVVYLFYPPQERWTPQLRAFQVSTGEDVLVDTLSVGEAESDPTALFAASQERIAWRARGNEIHVYDLETRTDEMVFRDEESYVVFTGIEMAGDLIMWASGSHGIIGYDLAHRRLFEIPDLPEEVQISSRSILISESYLVWFIKEKSPLSYYLMTPPPAGEPMPTIPPELIAEAEAEPCRRRLFVAPIIRE